MPESFGERKGFEKTGGTNCAEGLKKTAGPGMAEVAIGKRIEEKGRITFAEFMELALFLPEGGYYTSGRDNWGPQGDYVTNIDISPVFSVAIAKEVHEMWQILGSPGDFTLIEAGAGRGWLTGGILDTIKSRYTDLSGCIKAILVEKNPHSQSASPGLSGNNVTWLEDISEVATGINGCVLSNELIDSFPVHRVIVSSGELMELFVTREEGFFKFVPGEPSTPELAGYFEAAGVELSEGQTAEINLAASDWISHAGGLIDKGFVLTIDYGWPARELYGPERLKGTLLCHYRHTLNDDPFRNIGSQDITTHVDFSTLAVAGMDAGLELTGFTTQKNFLLGLGIIEEAAELETLDFSSIERIRLNQSIKELIMPGGPGDVFKVLVQHRGIERPELSGFSFKDMSSYL